MALTEAEKKEIMNDVQEFLSHVDNMPSKTITLTLTGKSGHYAGGGVAINKPPGRDLRFTE